MQWRPTARHTAGSCLRDHRCVAALEGTEFVGCERDAARAATARRRIASRRKQEAQPPPAVIGPWR
jgi:hypothetical protein